MIHTDVKDIIPRTEAFMIAFGWNGGTIHQIAEVTGCDVWELIYNPAKEYTLDHKLGWFAYCTNTLEYNQLNITNKMQGNIQFWIGVSSAVQTCIKLNRDTPKKF